MESKSYQLKSSAYLPTGKFILFVLLAVIAYWWFGDRPLHVGPDLGPESRVLILLHGHGADKNDLNPLAELLVDEVDGWSFVLPNAPRRVGFGGRSWFPRTSAESRSELLEKIVAIRIDAREVVYDIVEDLSRQGIPGARIYVGGFSQGASVALDTLISDQRGADLGGLVSLSGGAYDVELESLGERVQLRAFVSHGRTDPVLAVGKSRMLVKMLSDDQHEVEFVEFAGGHQIPREVIESLVDFLKR